MNKPFYPHISGLRAWAIALVCLYHFKVIGFAGGFIGVDIFFVISGFLMGGILDRMLSAPERKQFWLIDFVLARAQRILPAFLVVVLMVLPWGWLRLGPEEFNIIALEGLRAIFFVSNKFYAERIDYFAVSPDVRMFLNSWSLSVEWMFYMFIAILAFGVYFFKKSARLFFLLTCILSACSLMWMLVLRRESQAEAFFYLMPRAWELGFGILTWHVSVFYTPKKISAKRAIELSGFSLIIICLIFATDETEWPGLSTLLPVIGTGLILISAYERSVLTAPWVLQRLGDISYSVYLWHWPIVVVLTYEYLFDELLWKWVGIFASLAMGIMSWLIVERPTRQFLSLRGRISKFMILFTALVTTGLVLGGIRKFDGFPERISPDMHTVINKARTFYLYDDECIISEDISKKPCYIGGHQKPDLIVFGDSHAQAVAKTISETGFALNSSIEFWIKQSCSPLFGLRGSGRFIDCSLFLDRFEERLHNVPLSIPLMIASRFPVYIEGENSENLIEGKPNVWLGERPSYFDDEHRIKMIDGLVEGICRLGRGRKILLMQTVPELHRDPVRELEKNYLVGANESFLNIPRMEVESRQKSSLYAIQKAGHLCGAEMIPVLDVFCDNDVCSSFVDGVHAYYDGNHLNESGAMLLVPRLDQYLSLLNQ